MTTIAPSPSTASFAAAGALAEVDRVGRSVDSVIRPSLQRALDTHDEPVRIDALQTAAAQARSGAGSIEAAVRSMTAADAAERSRGPLYDAASDLSYVANAADNAVRSMVTDRPSISAVDARIRQAFTGVSRLDTTLDTAVGSLVRQQGTVPVAPPRPMATSQGAGPGAQADLESRQAEWDARYDAAKATYPGTLMRNPNVLPPRPTR